jgi:hypothetical protein
MCEIIKQKQTQSDHTRILQAVTNFAVWFDSKHPSQNLNTPSSEAMPKYKYNRYYKKAINSIQIKGLLCSLIMDKSDILEFVDCVLENLLILTPSSQFQILNEWDNITEIKRQLSYQTLCCWSQTTKKFSKGWKQSLDTLLPYWIFSKIAVSLSNDFIPFPNRLITH